MTLTTVTIAMTLDDGAHTVTLELADRVQSNVIKEVELLPRPQSPDKRMVTGTMAQAVLTKVSDTKWKPMYNILTCTAVADNTGMTPNLLSHYDEEYVYLTGSGIAGANAYAEYTPLADQFGFDYMRVQHTFMLTFLIKPEPDGSPDAFATAKAKKDMLERFILAGGPCTLTYMNNSMEVFLQRFAWTQVAGELNQYGGAITCHRGTSQGESGKAT